MVLRVEWSGGDGECRCRQGHREGREGTLYLYNGILETQITQSLTQEKLLWMSAPALCSNTMN